jgi:hypothetical protein
MGSQAALRSFFEAGPVDLANPGDLATEAVRRELAVRGTMSRLDRLLRLENDAEYRTLASEYRVIDDDTRLVVVDRDLANTLGADPSRVDWHSLVQASVRMRTHTVGKYGLRAIFGEDADAVYAWDLEYDSGFLGYMAGVLARE